MSFTDQKPFTVDAAALAVRRRVRRPFNCALCGRKFIVGDVARWIFANGTEGQRTGNFFVCKECDGENSDVLDRAKNSYETAVRLAKQWNIYGPDWQRDCEREYDRMS